MVIINAPPPPKNTYTLRSFRMQYCSGETMKLCLPVCQLTVEYHLQSFLGRQISV